MSHEPFALLDVSTLVVKPPRANEKAGKSAWIDRTSENLPTLFTSQKDARLLWPIRPGAADGAIKEHERLNLEISCSPEEEIKARECDEAFLTALYLSKKEFFGESKSKHINSKEAIKPMYKNLLREGGMAKDGSQYSNSFRMKVDGWASFVKNVNVIEKVKDNGEKMKIVKDCTWNDRIVEEGDRNAPSERDTHFFLFLGINPASGKPRYTDKVVCVDAAGKPIVKGEKDGKPIYQMRYVGPQDAMPGSNLTIVWSLSKLYITETTGPTSVAKDVYIKPQIKKVKTARALDGVEVDESADANESIAVLSAMHPEEENTSAKAEDVATISAPPAAAASEQSTVPRADDDNRKRKATGGGGGEGTPLGSSKKKKSSQVVEEDF